MASAGRPGHLPAAEHVKVKMRYALLRVRTAVDDAAKPCVGDRFLLRYACHHTRQSAQQSLVLLGSSVESCDVPTGNHQHVDGSLRIDVAEADGVVILVDDLRGYLAECNLAEETVDHGSV